MTKRSLNGLRAGCLLGIGRWYIRNDPYGKSWMRFEIVPKTPGYKVSLFWGREGQFTLYFGTNTHPWGKVYFFYD